MKRSQHKRNKADSQSPNGFALVTVLLLVSLLAVISITLHRTGTIHATLSYHQEDGETAYYTAMAGVQHARFVLIDNPSFTGPLDTSGPNEIPFGEGSYATSIINGQDVPLPGDDEPIPPMGEYLISSTGKVGSTVRTLEKWVCPAGGAPQQIVLGDDNDDQDTYLREEEPVLRYGGSPELRIGSDDHKGLRAAFQFDLNQIPAGASILSATLEIYMYGNVTGSAGSHLEVEAHRITRDWHEGKEIDVEDGHGACWDWYHDEHDWTTPGAEYDPAVLSTTNILYGDTNRWYGWDVTTLVQGWVDGTFPNDGLILKDVDEGFPSQNDSMEALFYSREWSNQNYRPKLTVVYQEPSQNDD